jgi:hypothetical protein
MGRRHSNKHEERAHPLVAGRHDPLQLNTPQREYLGAHDKVLQERVVEEVRCPQWQTRDVRKEGQKDVIEHCAVCDEVRNDEGNIECAYVVDRVRRTVRSHRADGRTEWHSRDRQAEHTLMPREGAEDVTYVLLVERERKKRRIHRPAADNQDEWQQ